MRRPPTYNEEHAPEPARAKKATSPEMLLTRQLRADLEPTHRKLLKWRSRLAWITEMTAAERLDTRRVRMELDVLFNEVRREGDVVNRIEAETPSASGHPRIAAIRTALDTIEAAVQKMLSQIGGR